MTSPSRLCRRNFCPDGTFREREINAPSVHQPAYRAYGGRILIDGEDIVGMSQEELRAVRRRKLGMIFQSFALLPHRTVLDNVVFGLEVQGIPEDERYQRGERTAPDGWAWRLRASMPSHPLRRHEAAGRTCPGARRRPGDTPDGRGVQPLLTPLIRREMQDELLDLQPAPEQDNHLRHPRS